nr:response regulator transcription factor [Halorhodospira abdelmalekii]
MIDDDVELVALLRDYLEGEGFLVYAAYDGEEALSELAAGNPELIVLDVMLPGADGFSVLRQLRHHSDTPVLMLTARGDDTDTVVGLELGADDYLAKPCNPRVLLARLRALLRRRTEWTGDAERAAGTTTQRIGDVQIDWVGQRIWVNDREVALTGAEWEVLKLLLSQPGHVVDKERISRHALGRALTPHDRSVDTHISNLRRKLGPHADGEPRIVARRGAGYLYRVRT